MLFTNVIYKKKYLLATQELEEVKKDNVALRAILKHWKAIENRTCESCKHWKVRNTLVVSNECFIWSGNVMTRKDFYCNRYEPKEIK